MSNSFDFAIIGAGMAGASLAAALSHHARVAIIEAESQPGYHATGRSVAFWTESYGGPQVYPLTIASAPYLKDNGFLSPRGAITIGRLGQEDRVEQFIKQYAALGMPIEWLSQDSIAGMVPGLRDEWVCGSYEPNCCDIDVAALHQHYLAQAQRNGAKLLLSSQLTSANYTAAGWQLGITNGHNLQCRILINAAGAWADGIAEIAGVQVLGITPLHRTVAQLRVAPAPSSSLPLVLDIAEQFYFKPESGRIWLSPHDETPSLPCDAAAEELAVATAIERLNSVVDWQVQRVERQWAGLRSFSPDRLPIYGYDIRQPNFFWFAGQGGFGIQTAPAAAELAAGLLLDQPSGQIDPALYAPARFG